MKKTQQNGVTQLQADNGELLTQSADVTIDERSLFLSVNLVGTLTEEDFRLASAEEIEEIRLRYEALTN